MSDRRSQRHHAPSTLLRTVPVRTPLAFCPETLAFGMHHCQHSVRLRFHVERHAAWGTPPDAAIVAYQGHVGIQIAIAPRLG
jgi:hypothetical protein